MIYTITTQKGGVGKTTTAAALTQAAAYKGRRALAIDLNPQGHLSYALAADATQPGSYALLHGTPAGDLVQHSPQGLDVIPASLDLQTEKSGAGTARRLQAALEPLKGRYSFIVIDTPTEAGELLYNALQAADRLIIPLELGAYMPQSIYQIIDITQQIQGSNPKLKIAGALLTKYRGQRSNIRAFYEAQLYDTLQALKIPFLGKVRQRTTIEEAAGLQQSLFEYDPRSDAAADYMQIYEAITKQK